MPSAVDSTVDSDRAEEILCPLCGYNLRGLPEPRCPECGSKFDWDDLTNPAKRRHPYLFEHHPERNIRSFVQTFIGGFRPRRFWRKLHPAQPYRPRRLVIYWFVCFFICLLLPLGEYVGLALQTRNQLLSTQQSLTAYYLGPGAGKRATFSQNTTVATAGEIAEIQQQYGSVQQYIDAYSPSLKHVIQQTPSLLTGVVGDSPLARGNWLAAFFAFGVFLECGLFLWPWAAMLSLMLLRTTMRQASVQRAHLMRVTIYSADVIIWLTLFQTGLGIVDLINRGLISFIPSGSWKIPAYLAAAIPYAPFVFALIVSYRFIIAIRQYLRFRHAFWVGFAVQFIFVLLVMQVMAVIYG